MFTFHRARRNLKGYHISVIHTLQYIYTVLCNAIIKTFIEDIEAGSTMATADHRQEDGKRCASKSITATALGLQLVTEATTDRGSGCTHCHGEGEEMGSLSAR